MPFAEFARQLCIANHEFVDGPVPCGRHRQQAELFYPLSKAEGSATFHLIRRIRKATHVAAEILAGAETRS